MLSLTHTHTFAHIRCGVLQIKYRTRRNKKRETTELTLFWKLKCPFKVASSSSGLMKALQKPLTSKHLILVPVKHK